MSTPIFDAVIVGRPVLPGAMIAKQLALAGKHVLILEGGRRHSGERQRLHGAVLYLDGESSEIPYNAALFDTAGNSAIPRRSTAAATCSRWTHRTGRIRTVYLIQKGPLAFASTYERSAAGRRATGWARACAFVPNDSRPRR